MSIATFSDLKTALAAWLNRADLTTQIPDFITLAEARFNRELRVNDMVTRATLVATSDYVTMPTDWLQTRSIRCVSDTTYDAMEYLTPEAFYDLENDALTGTVRYFTIIGGRLYMLPDPTGATVEMVYYQKIPALSDANTTNWLLTRSPDLYLFSSLLAAEAYLMNDERLPLWAAQVQKTIGDMNLESDRSKYPSGLVKMKKRTFG